MTVAAGTVVISTPKDKKPPASREDSTQVLGPEGGQEIKGFSIRKYEELVMGALSALKEKNGSSFASIAKQIEDRLPVPLNFKKVLNIRLKNLAESGKLIKTKSGYRVPNAADGEGRKKLRGEAQDNKDAATSVSPIDVKPSGYFRSPRDLDRGDGLQKSGVKIRREEKNLQKKVRVEVDMAKSKMRTAEEAAKAAAQAVAEAEAAAAAAEQAARDAEAAEAEAEAAEAAAEAAAAAVRPPKKRGAPKSRAL